MQRRPILRRSLLACIAGCLLLLVLARAVWREPEPAAAAPHTIRAVEYPFDPDWPDVYLMLATKCAECHRPHTDRTNLTSYDDLLAARTPDGEPLIVPGKPADSPLWSQVAWNVDYVHGSKLPDEPQMPIDEAEWLTRGQLEILARWIRNGALEYKLPETCSTRPLLEMDFPSARECRVCHPRQYDQWSRSMHHYAQHSPIFEAFTLTLVERTGGTIGTFCTRCHTPIGVTLGENASLRNVHRSQLSMEGVTCVACHRQSKPYYKSNARQYIQPGKNLDVCMFGPFDNPADSKLTGAHHAEVSPAIKTSAFCGACHDVTSPEGVRLEEAFSEWQNSPAARQGITCQQCHMGPVQGVPIAEDQRPLGRAAQVPGVDPELIPLRRLSNHTFAGPDYSILPDTEFPHKLDWMYETDYRKFDRLTPYQQKTLTELRKTNRQHLRLADEARYELLRNAAKIEVAAPESAVCGETAQVRVDVHSTLAGHSFPTGFTAERQAWVQITARDPSGNVVFASGDLDGNQDLRDGHSFEVESRRVPFDRYLLNFQNKFVALAQKGTERTVVLSVNRDVSPLNFLRPATGVSASFGHPLTFRIAKESLPPLRTRGRDYPIPLSGGPGPYTIDVQLNYRHIPPVLLDKIGIPHLKHLLEVVVIDQEQVVIEVALPEGGG